jgi:hypothetical protein
MRWIELRYALVIAGLSSVATSAGWSWLPKAFMTWVTVMLVSALFLGLAIYLIRDIQRTPSGHSGE